MSIPSRMAQFLVLPRRQKKSNAMKRILIYSPSPTFRALVCGLLSAPHVEQHIATSRMEFIERCQSLDFDCVATDDVQLFRSGDKTIPALSHISRPCIVVLSYNLSEDAVIAVLEECNTQYLSLPIEPQRLRRKMIL